MLIASVLAGPLFAGTCAVAEPDLRAGSTPSPVAQADAVRKTMMKIRLTINGRVAKAILEDTAIAQDFASLLPLAIALKDYASTEKVAALDHIRRDVLLIGKRVFVTDDFGKPADQLFVEGGGRCIHRQTLTHLYRTCHAAPPPCAADR